MLGISIVILNRKSVLILRVQILKVDANARLSLLFSILIVLK
jgi:hypothetical protein